VQTLGGLFAFGDVKINPLNLVRCLQTAHMAI
jgi:hypothetical protein